MRREVWCLRDHTALVVEPGVWPCVFCLLASSLCLRQDGHRKGTHVKPELKGFRDSVEPRDTSNRPVMWGQSGLFGKGR